MSLAYTSSPITLITTMVRLSLVPLVVLPFAAGSAVGAQQRDTTRGPPADTAAVRLPAVEVIGSVLHAAGPTVGSGVPARVAVRTAQQVRALRPRTLTDALAREPGISLYDDLGSPLKTTLVARGFTAGPVVGLPQGVSIFLDGVPVNEPDAGQVNFDLLPLDHIRRLELLNGTASLLGPHSLGGAVNLMTRRGDDDPGGEIELSVASHARWSATASHGGRARGGWSWYAGGGYASEDGWRQLTGSTHRHALLNIGSPGTAAGIRVQAFAATSNAETAGSLPRSVYELKPDSNLSAGDFEDIDQLHLAVSGYRPVGGGRSSAVVWFRASDAERFNVNQEDDPDVRSFSENRTVGASVDWRVTRPLGDALLGVRVGAGGSANRSRVRIFAERIDPGLTTDIESPIAMLDAYSLVDLVLGPFIVTGGGRYDAVRVPFRNLIDPARDTISTFRRFSPRGGVSLALGGTASLYASAGRSFRAPALIEIACADPNEPCPLPFALGDDPPIDAVVATTWEIGGRWDISGVELSASAYRTSVSDDIFLFPYADASEPAGSTIDGYFANIDRTRREGVEVGARFARGPLALDASWTVMRATFEVGGIEIFSIRQAAGGENEVARGDRLPLVPDRTASLGAVLALPLGTTVGVDARYTGERFLRGDEANVERPLGDYWITTTRVAVARGPWEARVIVRNVFDVEYATFGTFNINQGAGNVLERFLSPGEPRTMQLVVRRTIGREPAPPRASSNPR